MEDSEMDRALEQWTAAKGVVDRSDPVWGMVAYRLARYAMDTARTDEDAINRLQPAIADQLIRAVGSISANIAEGYSRGTFADRRRFYAYALGSVREAATWYAALDGRELSTALVESRVAVLTRIRRLLFGMLAAARKRKGGSLF